MSDNLGGDAIQFGFALWDAAKAALVGLNPLPVLVTSAFIGIIQSQRGYYLLKALIAVVPAVFIMSAWPMTSGFTPIWPDLSQMEVQLQMGALVLIAWVIIRLIYLMKSTLSLVQREPHPKPNGH